MDGLVIDSAEIERRARPLFDRATMVRCGAAGDGEAAQRRLLRWQQTAAGGEAEIFAQRLAQDGLDLAAAEAILTAAGDEGVEASPWLEFLFAADFTESGADGAAGPDGGAAPDGGADPLRRADPLPFEDLLLPFVSLAGARVASRVPEGWGLLSDTAAGSLKRQLLVRLTSLASQALFVEFSIYRQKRESALSRLLRAGAASSPNDLYRGFVAEFAGGRLAGFWAAYPVLARLVGTVGLLWIDSAATFLERLREDRERIASELNGGVDAGRVDELRAGVSDAHRGGRTAVVLRFASGLRAVYKPHGLGMETCWFDLLRWFNACGSPLPFRTLAVIDGGDHGWVEFAEHLPCRDEAEATDFFRRAGMLACLAYALGGSDLHLENVIASGAQPVIVDLEMALQPKRREVDPSGALAVAAVQKRLSESVLATGLLPAWVDGPGGKAMNLAGLGGAFSGWRALAWQSVNTDDMDRQYTESEAKGGENEVVVSGRSVGADQYTEQMVDGFETMYALMLEHRERLLAEAGPIERFAGRQVRFVFRPTMVYGRVLQYLHDPRFLRHGLDRSIEMDALARPFAMGESLDQVWQLYRCERQALERMDVPYFSLPAGGEVLSGDGAEVHGFLDATPLGQARARIEGMGEGDLRQQVELIRLSLSEAPQERSAAAGHAASDGPPAPASEESEALRDFAGHVGRLIAACAVRGEDGSAAWMGAVTADGSGHCRVQCLDHSLYEGAAGVAIFLAALENLAGGGFGELARAALAPVRRDLRERPSRLGAFLGIGAGSGLGGLVYALTRVGASLADEELVNDAKRAAALVTPELIAADRGLDVIGGSAGAILSLLALYDVAAGEGVLQAAVACGNHLVANLAETPGGGRSWATLEGCPPLAGFAHGAAGMAYALLRLYEGTGDPRFRGAAVESIEYERTLFVPEAGNWLDLRGGREGAGATMSAWCHGATGVGLARAGGVAVLDTPRVREEIETAIRTTSALGRRAPYRLCCGLAGRLELLLVAAVGFDRPDLRAEAARLLAGVVAQADPSRPDGLVGTRRMGLFQGVAGIGYACLRAAEPERVAPALLWRV